MKKEHTRVSLLELLQPYKVHGDKLSRLKKEILLEKAYELKLITKEDDPEPPVCNECECYIPLKDINNKIVEWTLIDKVDYNSVNKLSWYLYSNKNQKYAATNDKKLHQFLLGTPPDEYIIDHINHNGLDNTRKNLRFLSRELNSQNKKKKRKNLK